MHVLVVTQYFWPERFRVNDLALGLRTRGHQVTVLTGMPNYPQGRLFPGYSVWRPARESLEGIRVVRVPLIPRGQKRGWRLALNYLCFALSASALGPLRCRGQYTAILAYQPSPLSVGLPAVLLRRLRRVPLLFWVQDLWPESLRAAGAVRSRRLLAAVSRMARFIYRRCDRVLVQSRGFVERVVRTGADPSRVVYFPNWAEALYRPLVPAADSAERSELPSGFRVVFGGSIGAAQSFETVLAALDRLRDLRDLHLVVIGDGHRREWLLREIAERGLQQNVHLLGPRPLEAMPVYFALADALLVSLRRDPAFALTIPTKLQSYLASGRPIVAALDGEGARLVAESGAGLCCAAEDPVALEAALRELYQRSAAERRSLGDRGREYFERHFEREQLLDRLEGLIDEVSQERRCAS